MSNLTSQLLEFNLSELKEKLFPTEMFNLFGISVSDSVFSGFIVTVAILFVALIINLTVIKRWKKIPNAIQLFLEWIVTTYDNMARNLTGRFAKLLGPYTFGASAYIFFGVLIELFGFRPAIADVNAAFSLALCTFILINACGIREKGIGGRIKYYFKPVAFIAPIRLVTDCAVPVSMTFRLFGSILSGMIMLDLVYMIPVVNWFAPSVLSVIFTLFHALIQSYVFSSLTLAFVGEATE